MFKFIVLFVIFISFDDMLQLYKSMIDNKITIMLKYCCYYVLSFLNIYKYNVNIIHVYIIMDFNLDIKQQKMYV